MIIQKITKPIVHNIHYKIWAFITALIWWYCIHTVYLATIKIIVPVDDQDTAFEEKYITVNVQLNKLSYYAGYHTSTKFFLDKKPIHDIITIESRMILTHPTVRVVDFYPTVLHILQTHREEFLNEREIN